MKIAKLQLYRIQVPFKKPFRHALYERSTTDNLILETQLADGSLGYGEGLARTYLTGENIEGVTQALQHLPPQLFAEEIPTLEVLVSFLKQEIHSLKNLKLEKENNTARCLLELSLLDAFCQSFKKDFSEVLQLAGANGSLISSPQGVQYDGILSLDIPKKIYWSTLKLKVYGFPKVKIKVGGDPAETLYLLGTVRKLLGLKVDLRVDANGTWTLPQALELVPAMKPYAVSAIEQPLPAEQWKESSILQENSPIPLIADESLCSLADAERAVKEHPWRIWNLRLAKCGGVIPTLQMVQLARNHGIDYQLGCLVGETGILSAAGRQMATRLRGYRYLEGSYDRFLLKDNLLDKDISFGWGGKAAPIKGPGLGIKVLGKKLNQYKTQEHLLYQA